MKSVDRGPDGGPALPQERRHEFVRQTRFPGRIDAVNADAERMAARNASEQACESVEELLARRGCHGGNQSGTIFPPSS
jgi:hypothetical protein